MGTCQEHIGNQGEKKRFLTHLPLKKKKLHPSWGHAEPYQWLHEISLSKTVCHHFLPRLMAGAEFWRHSLWIRRQLAGLYFLISKFPLCSHEHRTLASSVVEETQNTPPPPKQALFSAFFRWSFFAFFAPCMVLCKKYITQFCFIHMFYKMNFHCFVLQVLLFHSNFNISQEKMKISTKNIVFNTK
jgi:hypothetical protein